MPKKRSVSFNLSGLRNYFFPWLLVSFMISVAVGASYVMGQQILRMNADDPQVQIARQTAEQISQGLIDMTQPPQTEDLEKSISLFEIIYDGKGKPLISSVKLNNKVPVVPFGSLEYAKKHGENRITWEPVRGVREAIVIVPFQGRESGYVVVGQTLHEVEVRENKLLILAGLMWGTAQIGGMVIFALWILSKKRNFFSKT